jgi:hypothetical protein
MKREGNTLSALIRQAWDGGELRSLTKNSPAVATDAHISIIGHITAEEVRRHLSETDIANGFANRFLWVTTTRSKVLPEGGTVDEHKLCSLAAELKAAAIRARSIGRMTRDTHAAALWREVYPALSDGGTGLLGSVTSRAEAHVMRLACIYAALEGVDSISVAHLRAALALWQYCARSCQYLFGEIIGSSTADQILEALRYHPGGMSRTEIRDFFQRHKSHMEVSAALTELEVGGRAHRLYEKSGGRPVEKWSLIPSTADTSGANVASVATPEAGADDPDRASIPEVQS